MAVITSYATLTTAVADYLARDDLTTFVPNFIQNAENKLYRTLNLRNEETALSVTVTSGTGTVPTDFKALKFAYVPDSPAQVLQWVPLEQLYKEYPTRSGATTPVLISREGTSFTFGPFAKDFTLTGIYYGKSSFTRDVDTTWYVTEAPEVLLYGALLESAPFIGADERLITWKLLFDEAVQTLTFENKTAEYSMGQLETRVV